MTTKRIALVSGVGPGTGAAIVRRFAAGGFEVAMLARTKERLVALEKEIPGARAFACDVSDEAQVDAALARVREELGAPSVLVHNAVGGAFGSFLDIDPK
ncbi:MAG: SDR family NAD(P)-dependent oxidoreductase, partial [Polyangiaceae bacterium]